MAIKIQARPTSRATTRLTVTHGWRIWCSNPVGLKQNQVSLCIKTRLFNDLGISDYSSKLTIVPCCWNRGWSDRWSFAGSERGRALRNTLCAKSKACQLNPKQSPRWCVSEAQTDKDLQNEARAAGSSVMNSRRATGPLARFTLRRVSFVESTNI